MTAFSTPYIDVTDVLLDPMVAGEQGDVFAVRRKQVVNNLGVASTINVVCGIVASVTPTGDNSLAREEAYQTQSKTIKVVTPFLLRGVSRTQDGTQYMPDVVWWRGDYYVVKDVNDFSAYGHGFVEADCASMDFGDLPPSRLKRAGALVFNEPSNSGLLTCF